MSYPARPNLLVVTSSALLGLSLAAAIGYLAGRTGPSADSVAPEHPAVLTTTQAPRPSNLANPASTTSSSTVALTPLSTADTTSTTEPALIVGERSGLKGGGTNRYQAGAVLGDLAFGAGEMSFIFDAAQGSIVELDVDVQDAAILADWTVLLLESGPVTVQSRDTGSSSMIERAEKGFLVDMFENGTVVVSDRFGKLIAYPLQDSGTYGAGIDLLTLDGGAFIVALAASGATVGYATTDGELGVVSLESTDARTLLPSGSTCQASDLGFSPTGMLGVARIDGSVEVWDPTVGQQIASIGSPLVPTCDFVGGTLTSSLAWSESGLIIAIGGSDGRVRLLELEAPQLTAANEPLSTGLALPVVELGFSSEGLLALDESGAVVGWKLNGTSLP